MAKCKIFLGMSGGVDSSVAALLLKEAGYDVQGVTLLLKPPSPQRDQDVRDAAAAAEAVGIPLHIYDKSAYFYTEIVRNFIEEYRRGRTPNPCVLCNPRIKFEALAEFAANNGGGQIATGHYVDTRIDADGVKRIVKNPTKKDQSYFLCRLRQEQVDAAVFPLGKYSKQQVRALAAECGIPCADKGDSQEVCFVPDNDYGAFLTDVGKLVPEPGDFIDTSGKVLGRHRGIIYYTHGQRRWLGISCGERMYVCAMDPHARTVTLCRESERYIQSLDVQQLHLIDGTQPPESFCAEVKIRSAAKPMPAVIARTGDHWKITLSERQTAAAPGQTAAFYRGDILLGGALIL